MNWRVKLATKLLPKNTVLCKVAPTKAQDCMTVAEHLHALADVLIGRAATMRAAEQVPGKIIELTEDDREVASLWVH